MSESFYALFHSDSSKQTYSKGRPHSFLCRLPTRLELHEAWEVALVELHLPMLLYNCYSKNCVATLKVDGVEKAKCELFDDHVSDVSHALKTLTTGFEGAFQFTLEDDRVVITSREPDKTSLHLSKTLALQLGFTTRIEITAEKTVAPHSPNMHLGLPMQAYVMCDIVKPQIVGENMLQVLRYVSMDMTNYRHGTRTFFEFGNPLYVPVAHRDIAAIKFDIKDGEGYKMPFVGGTSTVLLHFRKCSQE